MNEAELIISGVIRAHSDRTIPNQSIIIQYDRFDPEQNKFTIDVYSPKNDIWSQPIKSQDVAEVARKEFGANGQISEPSLAGHTASNFTVSVSLDPKQFKDYCLRIGATAEQLRDLDAYVAEARVEGEVELGNTGEGVNMRTGEYIDPQDTLSLYFKSKTAAEIARAGLPSILKNNPLTKVEETSGQPGKFGLSFPIIPIAGANEAAATSYYMGIVAQVAPGNHVTSGDREGIAAAAGAATRANRSAITP